MPQYLSPGVYVEEVPSAMKPIAGVSTSTAGFVGVVPNELTMVEDNPNFDPTKPEADNNQRTISWKFPYKQEDWDKALAALQDLSEPNSRPPKPKKDAKELGSFRKAQQNFAVADARLNAGAIAPSGHPVLCTTFSDFKKSFGDFSNDGLDLKKLLGDGTGLQNRLAHAVYGFFNNGGTRCYVMRFDKMENLQKPTALEPFEAIDEIALVAAPGITDAAVQNNVIDHCTNMSDRFAILDAPENPADLTEASIKLGPDTTYGALYFPRILVFDLPTKLADPQSNGEIFVSPSGHVAGIYSRVDHERGVHKAPANEAVRGALDVETQISRAQQDGLNPHGINCIRNLNNTIVVWGARTIGGDRNADLKYINVRRLLLFLRESIDEGTQWVVFEPNDRTLWAKIVRNVAAFLTTVWRDGALFGSTPQEAFYVKCDDETNPPEERDLGRVTTEIGVAIVRPAEFVIFRISQWAGPQGK